jgi:hypothetical protein
VGGGVCVFQGFAFKHLCEAYAYAAK